MKEDKLNSKHELKYKLITLDDKMKDQEMLIRADINETESMPILINRLFQVRFENYSISAFEDLNPRNKDIERLQHSLSHIKFANTDLLTDRILLDEDGNLLKKKKNDLEYYD